MEAKRPRRKRSARLHPPQLAVVRETNYKRAACRHRAHTASGVVRTHFAVLYYFLMNKKEIDSSFGVFTKQYKKHLRIVAEKQVFFIKDISQKSTWASLFFRYLKVFVPCCRGYRPFLYLLKGGTLFFLFPFWHSSRDCRSRIGSFRLNDHGRSL